MLAALMMRYAFYLVTLLFASSAAAQEMNYSADWYMVGATSPFMSSGIIADETACNQPATLPSVPNNVVNPGMMYWEHDPMADGNRWVCAIEITSIVRPFLRGSYFARLRAIDPQLPDEPSLESPNSNPFVAVAVPLAPGTVVITQ